MEDRKSQKQEDDISKLALTVKVGEFVDIDQGRVRVIVKSVNRYGRNQVALVFLAPRSVQIRRQKVVTTPDGGLTSADSGSSDPSQT